MLLVQLIFFRNIAIALAILSAGNAIVGALSAAFFPVGFFADKPITRIISDLAFLEGAAVFFLGALLAFFHSNITPRIIAMMVIGAAMIGISMVFGIVRLH